MRAAATRHPVDVTQLVAGLVFLGVATVWALWSAGLTDADTARWLLPLVLLGAGLAELGAWLTSASRWRRRDPE